MDDTTGPPLPALMRRLAEVPEDFTQEPRIGKRGLVAVSAVVGDLIRLLGHTPDDSMLARISGDEKASDRNLLSVNLLLCWLLSDDWFRNQPPTCEDLERLIVEVARQASQTNPAKKFVVDPERREELIRLALAKVGLRPQGETIAQAEDRLATLNSEERARVIAAARTAEKRSREIRAALAKKAAQEAADKWTRE